MKYFNVTVQNPNTGREEKHMYISRDRLFQNEDGEEYCKIYRQPSEVITTDTYADTYRAGAEVHRDQRRRSGEPYYEHPKAVRNIMRKFYPQDRIGQLAALLHDALEDYEKGGVFKSEEEVLDRIGQSIKNKQVKDEVIRDGEALAKQAGDELFGVTLFLIALISLSFGLWMLVVSRRMKLEGGMFDDPADQTVEVEQQDSQYKQLPDLDLQKPIQTIPKSSSIPSPSATIPMLNSVPQVTVPPQENVNSNIAPLPPTGLPAGWTMEQWEHYGWKYIEALSK